MNIQQVKGPSERLISALLVLNDEWRGNPKFEPPDLKVLLQCISVFLARIGREVMKERSHFFEPAFILLDGGKLLPSPISAT